LITRKFLAALVLFAMILHCSCRLGFLNLIYQNRQQISLSLGLISEMPIAMCNSDYDFGHELKVQLSDETASPLPPLLIQAREIILFFDFENLLITFESAFVFAGRFSSYPEHTYATPLIDIFQPPRV